MKDFANLELKTKTNFKNKDLLFQAFCHRSYLNENQSFELGHNERLEFLGDAVLELVVTESLFKKYPDRNEGELTSWRASLVNTKMLSETAKELSFGDYLLLSKGEEKENGRARQSVLADTFEAFIGALYLDSGYNKCYNFVDSYLIKKLPEIIQGGLYRDPKSTLQEEAQSRESITPTYKVLKQWGPDHKKNFIVGVFFKNNLIAQGQGMSKQEAEESAAREALQAKKW
jgi:ribonuclease III